MTTGAGVDPEAARNSSRQPIADPYFLRLLNAPGIPPLPRLIALKMATAKDREWTYTEFRPFLGGRVSTSEILEHLRVLRRLGVVRACPPISSSGPRYFRLEALDP